MPVARAFSMAILRGAAHHQMAHAVVAIDERSRGLLAHHANVWFGIETASLDAARILRQPADAVAVGALQIGLGHQRRDDGGIAIGQAELDHRRVDESLQPLEGDGRHYRPPNALKVMMVSVSWMPGSTCTFSFTKWPMSVSLST